MHLDVQQVLALFLPYIASACTYVVARQNNLASYFESADDQGLIQYQANITLPVHYVEQASMESEGTNKL